MKREIKPTPNHKDKTFTIRIEGISQNGKYNYKVRTAKMHKYEFIAALHYTPYDWDRWFKYGQFDFIKY